jgi:hypothetical protein
MTRRAAFRYLGNQDKLVVHDLDHEDEERCEVQPLLRSGMGVTFRPDRLTEAVRRDFALCPFCLPEVTPASVLDAAEVRGERLESKEFLDHAHQQTP